MIQSSGKVSADGLVSGVPCMLWGYTWTVDADKKADLTLRDSNVTGSQGARTIIGFASGNDSTTVAVMLAKPVRCFQGIHADLSATEGDAVVYYEVL